MPEAYVIENNYYQVVLGIWQPMSFESILLLNILNARYFLKTFLKRIEGLTKAQKVTRPKSM